MNSSVFESSAEELAAKTKLSSPFRSITGCSPLLYRALCIADKAAKSQSTVLITGESGTGKELVARAIHEASARSHGPFVRVNCAGIPVTLIESELFGHERGAFTGAIATRKGKFELAQNGTIFLDEIGELPLEVQAKLLRVLQERELERVGGDRVIPLNVRIVAATHRNLLAEVRAGRFREDLYYRINVVKVQMPPLRDRKSDIPQLVQTFLRELRPVVGKAVEGCSETALSLLQQYAWPGNVRELRNVIEQAMNLCDGSVVLPEHLPEYISVNDASSDLSFSADPDDPLALEAAADRTGQPLLTMAEYERRIIARALRIYPSFNAAAKALGLTHKTVAAKARKYGLVETNNALRKIPRLRQMPNLHN